MAADSKPTNDATQNMSAAPNAEPVATDGSKPVSVSPCGPGSATIAKSKMATMITSSVSATASTLAFRSTRSTPSTAITAPATRHHQYHSIVMPSLSDANAAVATPNRP